MPNSLVVIVVNVRVLPEALDDFRAATVANATASLGELGCLRFDVVQEVDDPTRFVLFEAYRDAAGHAAHKETPHYQTWRDAVNTMMAEPRTSKKFVNVHPADANF